MRLSFSFLPLSLTQKKKSSSFPLFSSSAHHFVVPFNERLWHCVWFSFTILLMSCLWNWYTERRKKYSCKLEGIEVRWRWELAIFYLIFWEFVDLWRLLSTFVNKFTFHSHHIIDTCTNTAGLFLLNWYFYVIHFYGIRCVWINSVENDTDD